MTKFYIFFIRLHKGKNVLQRWNEIHQIYIICELASKNLLYTQRRNLLRRSTLRISIWTWLLLLIFFFFLSSYLYIYFSPYFQLRYFRYCVKKKKEDMGFFCLFSRTTIINSGKFNAQQIETIICKHTIYAMANEEKKSNRVQRMARLIFIFLYICDPTGLL